MIIRFYTVEILSRESKAFRNSPFSRFSRTKLIKGPPRHRVFIAHTSEKRMGRRGAFKSGPNAGPRPVPLIQRTRKFLQVQGKINSRIQERESAADIGVADSSVPVTKSFSSRCARAGRRKTCAFLYFCSLNNRSFSGYNQ